MLILVLITVLVNGHTPHHHRAQANLFLVKISAHYCTQKVLANDLYDKGLWAPPMPPVLPRPLPLSCPPPAPQALRPLPE